MVDHIQQTVSADLITETSSAIQTAQYTQALVALNMGGVVILRRIAVLAVSLDARQLLRPLDRTVDAVQLSVVQHAIPMGHTEVAAVHTGKIIFILPIYCVYI